MMDFEPTSEIVTKKIGIKILTMLFLFFKF